MSSSRKYDPNLYGKRWLATTLVKNAKHHNVTTAINKKTGVMEYFLGDTKVSLQDGVALSTGKDNPLDKSRSGVFPGCDFKKEKEQ